MKNRLSISVLWFCIIFGLLISGSLWAQETQRNQVNSSSVEAAPVIKPEIPMDATSPVTIYVSCQGDVLQVSDSNDCSGQAFYTLPAYTGGVLTIDGPPSGSIFPLGVTTIVFTVTGQTGQTVSCSIQVEIIDDLFPTLSCPPDVYVSTNPGSNTATAVDLGVAEAADNCGIAVLTNNALWEYAIGTTVITWTAMDNAMNQVVCEQTVTVLDEESPIMLAPPSKVVNTNPGKRYATNVDLGTPTVTDNIGVTHVFNDAPEQFPDSTTVVTWIAVDAAGNTAMAPQSVTVIDNEPPVIQCGPDLTVSADPGLCSAGLVTLVPPLAWDNAEIAYITNNALSSYPVGTTTITWLVTDPSGNGVTCNQSVTVTDNDPPAITCPANIAVNTNRACAGTAVTLGDPVVLDNCSAVTVSSNAPVTFPLGTTTVIWTAVDGYGNSTACAQVVSVFANTAPTINGPGNVVTCAAQGASSKMVGNIDPVINETCPYNLTYQLSGATTATGNCTAQGGISGTWFNLGTTTVTYTLTGVVTGLSSQCSFIVTVNPSSPAVIQSNDENDFCNGVNLTASPTGVGYSYLWSNGQTTESIFLALNSASGTYTVTISDPQGCVSPSVASYAYNPGSLLSSYTILAFEELQFNDYNEVQSGAVGLTGANRMAHAKKYVKINGPGSFLQAHTMNIHNTAIVPNRILSPATVDLPPMLYNTTTGFVNNITIPANTTAIIADNYNNYTIGAHCHITFTGNAFGKIVWDAGTTVTFTQPVIDIQEMDAKMATASDKSYLKFAQDAVVRVPKTIRIQENCVVNPDPYHVVFYVGVDETGNPGELQVFPKGTTFNASAYVPYGQIHTEHDASTSEPGIMNGQFIAKKFISNGKYVFWNWKTCTASPNHLVSAEVETEPSIAGDAQIQVYPNPFSHTAYIDLILPVSEEVDITIYNMMGVRVATLLHQVVQEKSPYQIKLNEEILNESGLYLVRVSVGSKEYAKRLVFLR